MAKKQSPDPIDIRNKGSFEEMLNPAPARHHSMQGFEERFTDIVDYIIRITHQIWEQADMGYIYDTYSHNCTVHTAYGTSYGVEDVVSGSVAMLAGFPDRAMFPEDVIWRGDDASGFHTSHLIMNRATNTGFSAWGPPTMKPVKFFAVANCVSKENRIFEEWLVRDTAAIVRQLGFDIRDIARRMPADTFIVGETERLKGQLPPAPYEASHKGDPVEDNVRRHFHEVWNRRHFNKLTETHSPDAVMFVPNHIAIQGVKNIRTYIMGFIAMFPDATMSVEHVYWLGDAKNGYRAAVRWRFEGTHANYGWYGQPTRRRVSILGISQLHIKNQKIDKHYMVFDDLAVHAQLLGET